MKTFKFYSDCQHGWLAVKMSVIQELGIGNLITPYSYMKGATAYLEEDQDVGTFLKAYRAKYNDTPEFVPGKWRMTSPIRNYDRFDLAYLLQVIKS